MDKLVGRACPSCSRPLWRDEFLVCSLCSSSAIWRMARLLNVEASYLAYQRFARWRLDQLAIR